MKPFKSLTVAALLALSSAGMASATTTTLHITGSTAYRGSTVTAIANVLNAQGAGGVTAAYSGSSLTGANQSILFGPVVSGNQTIVECSWSGSVGGLQTLTGPVTISTFLSSSTYSSLATAVTLGGGSTAATGGLSISGTPTFETPVAPDVAMTDVFKKSTPYNLASVTENTVGIVPFKFMAGNGSPAGLTNMTPQLAQWLFINGNAPLSFFTGNHADETSTIIALGRDPDSGTRLTAFAESGVGVFTQVAQSYPLNAGSAIVTSNATGPITSTEIVPASTVNGSPVNAGNGGYSSGGQLAGSLTATNSIANTYFVTYLGFTDAATALGGGAKELTYNGATFGVTSIEEGQYTFWGYEHLDYLNSLVAAKKNFATAIKTQLNSGDDLLSGAGITFSAMNVTRSTDGANVQPLF